MLSTIETLNYSCLKYISQPLSSFNILVGPNASGKTTFLDVVDFLSHLVSDGPDAAIGERTANVYDLLWKKSGNRFELAIEAIIPDHIRRKLGDSDFRFIRYEVAIGINRYNEISILDERGLLKKHSVRKSYGEHFPEIPTAPKTILTSPKTPHKQTIFSKIPGGNDNYYSETSRTKGGGWKSALRLGPRKSAFGNLLEEESNYPASTWLKNLLVNGVQKFVLNSSLIRKPSRPGQSRYFKPDGSNLPWLISRLKEKDPERFQHWILHLQTAIPDIEDIFVREREDDRHRYLIIRYQGGMEVPSWMVSDGTLRLLALTLPAYLTDFEGIYLIEEPENGIHPCAAEIVIQSLSSVYNAQMLIATHSPIVLSVVSADRVLCFAKNEEGATDIIPGNHHPLLRDWKGEENLGVLYTAGVLG